VSQLTPRPLAIPTPDSTPVRRASQLGGLLQGIGGLAGSVQSMHWRQRREDEWAEYQREQESRRVERETQQAREKREKHAADLDRGEARDLGVEIEAAVMQQLDAGEISFDPYGNVTAAAKEAYDALLAERIPEGVDPSEDFLDALAPTRRNFVRMFADYAADARGADRRDAADTLSAEIYENPESAAELHENYLGAWGGDRLSDQDEIRPIMAAMTRAAKNGKTKKFDQLLSYVNEKYPQYSEAYETLLEQQEQGAAVEKIESMFEGEADYDAIIKEIDGMTGMKPSFRNDLRNAARRVRDTRRAELAYQESQDAKLDREKEQELADARQDAEDGFFEMLRNAKFPDVELPGDTEVLDGATKFRFAANLAGLRNEAEATAIEDAQEVVAGLINGHREGEAVTFKQMYDQVEAVRNEGNIPETQVDSLYRTVEAYEARVTQEAVRAATVAAEEKRFSDAVATVAANGMGDARNQFGLSDEEAQKVFDRYTMRFVAGADTDFRGLVRAMGENDMVPTVFTNMFKQVGTVDPEDEIPDAHIEAFQVYREMNGINPLIAARAARSGGSGALNLMQLADFVAETKSYKKGDQFAGPIRDVARMLGTRDPSTLEYDMSGIKKAVGDVDVDGMLGRWFRRDVRNQNEVLAWIQSRATMYSKLTHQDGALTVGKAIKDAGQQFEYVNGRALFVGRGDDYLPHDIERILNKHFLPDIVEKYGDDEDIQKTTDVSIARSANSGQYIYVRADTGEPLSYVNANEKPLTTHRLRNWVAEATADMTDKEREKFIEAYERRVWNRENWKRGDPSDPNTMWIW
jgi:hypothetical protein